MASKEFITKLKDSLDIAQVVAETVQLTRKGKHFTGLSPFSKEKSPSFFVDQEKQSFYCFSTNQGGDVITFVELTKGLSFNEAIQFLAVKAGIPMEVSNRSPEQVAKDRQIEEDKKLLLKLNRFAARFFQEQFEGPAGALARDYALKRGISQESLLQFGIGYAPDSWTLLRDYFLKIKAPMVKSYELGLFRTKGGEKPKEDGSNLFDTFRNRLIFPIRDPNGEVLGFGGRWLGASTAEAPKYLNSMESAVYEKEKILYNLDLARKSIREMETAVLVEGYMDCLAMVQAGFSNVVANCGTALTRTQAGILRKLAPKVICLYDSDVAGQAATERAMDLFLETEGFPLLGAVLPDGKDPDDFLKAHGEEGKILLAQILQNSPALVDKWMEKTITETPNTVQARAEALDKIAKKLAKLREDLWIQARLPSLAKSLEMEPGLVIEAIRKYRKNFGSGFSSSYPARKNENPKAISGPIAPQNRTFSKPQIREKGKQFQARSGTNDFGFERRFLCDLLRQPDWIAALRERHANDPNLVLSFLGDVEIKKAFEILLAPLHVDETNETRLRMLEETTRDQTNLRNLLAKANMNLEDSLPAKDLDGAIARMKDEALKRKTAELRKQIDDAEKRGDSSASETLLQELTDLRRKIGKQIVQNNKITNGET